MHIGWGNDGKGVGTGNGIMDFLLFVWKVGSGRFRIIPNFAWLSFLSLVSVSYLFLYFLHISLDCLGSNSNRKIDL